MKRRIKRMLTIGFSTHFNQTVLLISYQKLIKCHRIHKHGMNSTYTECWQFLQCKFKQRTSGYNMKFGIVFLKETKCHYGFGAFLYFIQEQKGFAFFYRYIYIISYFLTYKMYVYITLEKFFYRFIALKIDLCKISKATS